MSNHLDITVFGAIPGTDATVAIQLAINTANHGDFILVPFKYFISSPIVIDGKAVHFAGIHTRADMNNNSLGSDGSVLTLANGANCDMIQVIDSSGSRLANVRLSDLVLEGNKGNNTLGNGIVLDSVSRVRIERMRIRRMAEHGLHTKATYSPVGCNVVWANDNEVLYCNGNGVNAGSLADSFIHDNSVGSNGANGISVGSGNRVRDNHCYLNGSNGMAVAGKGSNVSGNKLNDNQLSGLLIYDSFWVNAKSNHCFNNNRSDTGKSGIRVSNSKSCILLGNNSYDTKPTPTQEHGIEVVDTQSTGTICANDGSGNIGDFLVLPSSHQMKVIN